jgi:bifunctional non-homologous end joining protein LigD
MPCDPSRLAFYAFDLVYLDGLDRRRYSLLERKTVLAEVLARSPERLLLSEHLTCDGRALFEKVGELGGEGIVSKRIDAPYTSGPSSTWLKAKHASVGTYPVVGYVPDRPRIEALLMAERPSFRLVGRIEFAARAFWMRMPARRSHFWPGPSPASPVGRPGRGVRWVEPRLVATVKHFGRTGSGRCEPACSRDSRSSSRITSVAEGSGPRSRQSRKARRWRAFV